MVRSVALGLLQFLFVSLPRFILALALYLLSIVSRQVGKLGTVVFFRGISYLPIRLLLSPKDARLLRDDFMLVMDGAADALLDEHFGEGHPQELMYRDLRKRLERGEIVNPQKYNVGEFGVSLLLTLAALSLVYFQVPRELAEQLSIIIAVTTLILLFAISTRTLLIELLAYEEPSKGSLIEDTKRLAWNGAFLSDLYPLTTILLLKASRLGGDDIYRLTAYSFGIGLERAIRDERSMMMEFAQVFLDGCQGILADGGLPAEVPSAREFSYLKD